jgi:peptidoglycan-associated lipoprotein
LPLAGPLYFETDTDTLTSESRAMLVRVASYMKARADAHLVVTGNCDERGDPAYNLALGERRAQAARTYLATLGVDTTRVKAVSLGEEIPVVDGHGEDAWSWNRRDEFQFVVAGQAQAALYKRVALP